LSRQPTLRRGDEVCEAVQTAIHDGDIWPWLNCPMGWIYSLLCVNSLADCPSSCHYKAPHFVAHVSTSKPSQKTADRSNTKLLSCFVSAALDVFLTEQKAIVLRARQALDLSFPSFWHFILLLQASRRMREQTLYITEVEGHPI
jgi:hypothetical protein